MAPFSAAAKSAQPSSVVPGSDPGEPANHEVVTADAAHSAPAATAVHGSPGSLGGSDSTVSAGQLPVLIIEDEPSIVQLLSTLLQPHRATVLCARTGVQALELLARERPVLITLDLVLPDLDGFSVLQRIRSRRELDDVPVLMISAQAEPAAQRRAYQGGVSDFIAKPFHVDLLDAKLRAWLRLAQRTSRLHTLRDFAHEVRNPLTAIGAAAHRLTHPDLSVEQRQRLGRAIAGEAERLSRMVVSYLDGASSGSGLLIGAPLLTPNPLAVVCDLLELNLADSTRPRVHLRGGEVPAIRIDPDHLRQMVLNLVENALAATAQRGEVELSLEELPDGVRITVADTGCGIASEHLPHIFEDGYTTRSDKQRGLGLGITQRLCNRAGGTLRVDSSRDRGTIFTLELPRA